MHSAFCRSATPFALAIGLFIVPAALTLGCGDDADGAAPGGAGGSGGTSGRGGTGGSAGSGASAGTGTGGRPAIPPPAVESCSALAPTYAGGGCTRACTSVRCVC